MKRFRMGVAGLVVTTSAWATVADDLTAEPDTTKWLDEVSVTAIKQSSDISLLPTALTVIGESQVERFNVLAVKNVSEIAPNFYIPDYGSRMTSSIYVRGIGARIDQPVVGLNIDNVPFLNKDNYDFDLGDIERVEIMRGPQSTLYGRNTMGGQINIYTISPMKYQGSRVMAETGKGPVMRMSIAHYEKLSDRLAMGISGYFNYFGGYFTNLYDGRKVGTEKSGSLRWRTEWRPRADLSIGNVAAFALSHQGGYPYEYAVSGEINYNDTCFYRRNGFSDGLTVRWISGDVSVSSVSSVQYLNDNMTLDQDFLPLDYFTLTQKRHEWNVTHDMVARGSVGNYDWLGGVFGFYKHTSMWAPVTFKDVGIRRLIEERRNEVNPFYPITWDERSFVLGSDFSYPVYGLALYHQSSLDLGRFNLAMGLRLDYEHASLRYRSHCNTGYTIWDATGEGDPTVFRKEPVDIDDTGRLSKSFLQLLPKLTVSYRLPVESASDVYMSVAKGYKSGGFNTQMFSDVLQQRIMGMMGVGAQYDVDDVVSYKPEKSWNYELGAHMTCADGRVRTDMALFYIDCRDQQLTMFPDGTTTGRITSNAGKTRSYGAEVQIGYSPVDRWSFNFSYGYTNARFREFFNGKTDYSGKRVPYAPQNTLFADATYVQPINRSLRSITFNLGVRGVGSIYWNEENDFKQPFYAQLGGEMTFDFGWLSVGVWGENITNTKFHTFWFQSIGNAFVQRGKPARMGATVRLTFDS